jgi:hypothetical protein
MKKFRVHHILCTVLYRGEGYSGTFCVNMTQKVRELKADPEEPLMNAVNSSKLIVISSVFISGNLLTRHVYNILTEHFSHIHIQ